jgi:hypothetical protein
MQPTGICGGEISPESNVSRVAYPGPLIAIVGLKKSIEVSRHE